MSDMLKVKSAGEIAAAARAGVAAETRESRHVQPRAAEPETQEPEDDGRETRHTRRSRLGTSTGFDVPQEAKRPGYDYHWWPTHIYNEPVSPGEVVDVMEGGWQPVRAKDMPSMVPPGWPHETIDRGGQRLYMRPMSLSIESRREDELIARQQIDSSLSKALIDNPHIVNHVPLQPSKVERGNGNLDVLQAEAAAAQRARREAE